MSKSKKIDLIKLIKKTSRVMKVPSGKVIKSKKHYSRKKSKKEISEWQAE